MRVPTPHILGAIAAATLILLAGCTPQWRLTEERVNTLLDRAEESWPMCEAPAAGTAEGNERSERSDGACGGTLSASFEHGDGDTDWTIDLDQFCLDSDDGEVVFDGSLKAFEDGTPSATGPVVDSVEVSTDGPLNMEHDGETVEIEIDALLGEYGYPDVEPGEPDAEHPNVITAAQVLFTNLDQDNREDFVRDVRVEITGGDQATVTVLEGQGGTEDDGFVELRTAEDDPIVIDFPSLDVISGSLELVGAGDTVLAVTPDPDRRAVFTLSLNGEDFAREVDCSDATQPLVQAMFALLVEAPLF